MALEEVDDGLINGDLPSRVMDQRRRLNDRRDMFRLERRILFLELPKRPAFCVSEGEAYRVAVLILRPECGVNEARMRAPYLFEVTADRRTPCEALVLVPFPVHST